MHVDQLVKVCSQQKYAELYLHNIWMANNLVKRSRIFQPGCVKQLSLMALLSMTGTTNLSQREKKQHTVLAGIIMITYICIFNSQAHENLQKCLWMRAFTQLFLLYYLNDSGHRVLWAQDLLMNNTAGFNELAPELAYLPTNWHSTPFSFLLFSFSHGNSQQQLTNQ